MNLPLIIKSQFGFQLLVYVYAFYTVAMHANASL